MYEHLLVPYRLSFLTQPAAHLLAVMYTLRFILSSLSILASLGTKTVSDTTTDESNNFNGLVLALQGLGYESVPSFPAPDLIYPSPPVNSSSNGCAVTVSMIE